MLLVVVAIAGLVFGRDAAEGAIVDQFSGLMGHQTAEALQGMIESAAKPREGTLATIIGMVVLFIAIVRRVRRGPVGDERDLEGRTPPSTRPSRA